MWNNCNNNCWNRCDNSESDARLNWLICEIERQIQIIICALKELREGGNVRAALCKIKEAIECIEAILDKFC